jgi:hypothetical protein
MVLWRHWAENPGFFGLIARCIRLRAQVDSGLVFPGFGRMQYIQQAHDDRDQRKTVWNICPVRDD